MKSNGYKKYLYNLRREKFLITLAQIFILMFLIILWQFLADKEFINIFITSSPKNIFNTILNLYHSNNLFNHIWITIYETIISFILGTVLGIIIAIVMWYNKFISKVIDLCSCFI